MSISPRGLKISDLFNPGVKYEIPIYQRRYVWSTENWTALWEDIKKNSKYIKNTGLMKNHFTGAIVTQEIARADPRTHEIIDGQQRLTTFQIIFSVIRDLCRRGRINDKYSMADTLNRFLINDLLLNAEHKLVPTEYDRDAFAVVVNDGNQTPFANSRICEAYTYFLTNIEDYIGDDYTEDRDGYQHAYKELHNLYKAISTNFSVVLIEISDEESQKIFETLNATGRQLSEFDYLRNDLFLRVGTGLSRTEARQKRRDFYRRYWSKFESPYNEWDNEKQEAFLSIFLEAILGSKIFQQKNRKYPNRKVFNLYRDYSNDLQPNQDPEYEIKQLTTYGLVYQRMTTRDDGIGNMMQFYEDLNITEMPPIILYIISELAPADGEIRTFLKILESYIVRCKLVDRYQGKIYAPIQKYFRSALKAGTTTLNIDDLKINLRCPIDDDIRRKWAAIDYAKSKRLLRYILFRIECHKRASTVAPDVEHDILRFSKLKSIEHVMPQSWRTQWPLDLDDGATPTHLYFRDLYTKEYKKNNSQWETLPDENGLVVENQRYLDAHDLALSRIAVENSIGNLTPMSEKANAGHLGNNSFDEKKSFLSAPGRSNLVLTDEIIKYPSWDAEDIKKRGDGLLENFLQIWPMY